MTLKSILQKSEGNAIETRNLVNQSFFNPNPMELDMLLIPERV